MFWLLAAQSVQMLVLRRIWNPTVIEHPDDG